MKDVFLFFFLKDDSYREPVWMSFDSALMGLSLTEFEKQLPDAVVVIDIY